MSRPRILITPAVFLSASIVAGSAAEGAIATHATGARTTPHPATASAMPAIHVILARFADVCHTR